MYWCRPPFAAGPVVHYSTQQFDVMCESVTRDNSTITKVCQVEDLVIRVGRVGLARHQQHSEASE